MSYTFMGPELGGRLVYADESYEMDEYGNERAGFTEAELSAMYSDPRYGYVCAEGHRIDQNYASHMGGCRVCDDLAEARCADYDYEREYGRPPAPYVAPPAPTFEPDNAPF